MRVEKLWIEIPSYINGFRIALWMYAEIKFERMLLKYSYKLILVFFFEKYKLA